MDVVINLEPIIEFIQLPPDVMMWRLLLYFGWIPIVTVLIWGIFQIWMDYITGQFASKQKFIFLAIDIPRGNIQSPKAVENMFTYIAGAHGSANLIEKYWDGKIQLSFSFEIVSIDGYTQFIIRTPEPFRSLVETAIYSQYPDSEINEIQDYTEGMPKSFPDDDYDIWGTEFIPAAKDVIPIRTYSDFEHQLGEPESTYRDTMALLMDLYSSLRKGEQLWMQILVKPIGIEWLKRSEEEIKALVDKFKSPTMGFSMFSLPPKEKNQVEAISRKATKLGFECKMRVVYIAKKDVINKPKAVNGVVGYIKQFGSMELNSLKPDMAVTATSTAYFWKDSRMNDKKNTIMRNYISRSGQGGRSWWVLNIEELATLWHFPIESVVKAPLIQKSPGRKAEPPMTLPMDDLPGRPVEIDSIFKEEILPARPLVTEQEISEKKNAVSENKNSALPEFMIGASDRQVASTDGDRGAPPSNLPFA
jgi:hypothetical protein